MGRKCDLSDVDCGMVVRATWAWLIIFETPGISFAHNSHYS